MLKYVLVLLLMTAMILEVPPAESAKSRRKKTPRTQTQVQKQEEPPAPVSLTSLQGKWTGEGGGSGTDSRQPGATLSLSAEDVVLEIDNIKFSETSGEGMADVIFTGRITDVSGNVRHLREWAYSIPYDMKREGVSSWSFSTEYLDGEDKITVTLTSPSKAILRWEGANWDDDYPDEHDTFDVTCTAAKK
ncbi:MAG: hypothetical protein IJR85_00265 [Synergistaceae bacterium]|nr:hypothetical protein [Synergistaceae bacterium]